MRPFLLLALLLLPSCDDGPKPHGKAPPVVEDAQVFRAQLEMRTLAAELAQYRAVHGDLPEDWRALRRSGKDPWGNDYAYEADGEGIAMTSAGPDGEFGTDDDLGGP